MNRLGLLLLILVFPSVATAQPIKRDDLKPGLLFTTTDSSEPPASFTRLEPTVGITLDKGQTAHPQSSGGSTFTWLGTINIITPGKYRFSSTLTGRLVVKIADKEVLAAASDAVPAATVNGEQVELEAGIQIFSATLTRTGESTRAELLWTGPGFRTEPIPHFFFGHLPKQRPASYSDGVARDHGRFLFEELSCVKCHASGENNAIAAGLVERTGPNLGEIGKRAYAGWLDAWLADPQRLRPHTHMPKMFKDDPLGQAQRYAVVAYLVSLGGPLPHYKPPTVLPNPEKQSQDRGAKLYITSGCAACHGDQLTQPPSKKKSDDDDDKPVYKPEDWIHSQGEPSSQSFYMLGAIGSKTRLEPLARFLRDPLATNPHGRMPNMTLTAQEAEDIARHMIRVTDEKIRPEMPPEPKQAWEIMKPTLPGTPDDVKNLEAMPRAQAWQQVGKMLFVEKGCASCHAVNTTATQPMKKAPAFESLTKNVDAGCMSRTVDPAKAPVYPLTAEQSAALTQFLKFGTRGPGTPAPTFAARAALKRFNCLNCHIRDGEGGIDTALSDKMKSLENAQNADDIQPPRITGVGHKMRTSWMRDVLVNAGRARPWMTLRMPQYGKQNVDFLADALPLLEGTTTDDSIGKAVFSAEKLDTGRTLAGKGGHGCITCHDISGVVGGGTRGPDLATTNKRVRFDWYVRWMHQPQRMAPGTKMPQAFIDGKALLDSIYAGDGDKQIEALWAYFSLGPGLPLPIGLEPPKGVIVAARDRTELMRTFMPDNTGTKGIAVAFPTGVNMVFDTSRGRLSYAWSGNFLDMSPVWVNRGGNQAKLLGPKFWTAPNGQPWGISDGPEPPDFAKLADDPAYGAPPPPDKVYMGPLAVKFDGYSLDTLGTPTFKYSVSPDKSSAVLKVQETPVPAKVTVAYGVTRKFALEAPAGKTIWFNVGDAKKEPRLWAENILSDLKLNDTVTEVPSDPAKYLILPQDGDRVLVVHLAGAPAGVAWWIGKAKAGGYQVLLRLPDLKGAKAELILNIWSLARTEEKILQGLK